MDYYVNTNICNGGKLLVLILYNNHEEMRLLRMHPESIMVDTTYGTNRGKKELFTVAGKDDNNVAFNACRAFLPNQQQWVFNSVFSECLPHFFGKLICNRMKSIISDGATIEYVPILKTLGRMDDIHSLCTAYVTFT